MNKTMSINHHPSDALLIDYAAGSLGPARALVIAAALAMGWSRIALGVHFPSDVLAAWCLGTACAVLVQRLGTPPTQRWPWGRASLS